MALGFSPDGRTVAAANYLKNELTLYEVATGKQRAVRKLNYGWHPLMLSFSPDGHWLAAQTDKNRITLWHLPLASDRDDTRSLVELWADLADADSEPAYRAIAGLIRADRETIALFKEKLRPVLSVESDAIAKTVRDLDDDDFAVREEATRTLEKLGEGAAVHLRKMLQGDLSLEVRCRIEAVLSKFAADSPGRLREKRALEVLESIGGTAARDLLKALAAGAPEAGLTQDARDAQSRMKKAN